MGLHNTLHATLTCPRCGQAASMEIETKFGFLELIDYQLGDRVHWHNPLLPTQSDQHPPNSIHSEFPGYAECPTCHKDFWVTVRVKQDHIESVTVDNSRPGYIP